MHGTQMVGAVWTKIPGLEQRGTCATCNTSESMSHILIHCTALPATTVWNLAKELWPHDSAPWPQLSLGAILGCSCLSAQIRENEDEQNEPRNEDRKWTSAKHRCHALDSSFSSYLSFHHLLAPLSLPLRHRPPFLTPLSLYITHY